MEIVDFMRTDPPRPICQPSLVEIVKP